MGLFNRMKLNKIKRSEVVDTIVELTKKENELMTAKDENTKKIDALFNQGKNARDKQEQLLCAKQINVLKAENKSIMNNLMYITSNISALNQLKNAIDDKEFIKTNKNVALNKILTNTSDLSSFLKKINSQKMYNEEKMANTLDTFDEVNNLYEGNERIFGESQKDNELLAMFEYASIDDMSSKSSQKVQQDETNMFNEEFNDDDMMSSSKRKVEDELV